ncbi:MAG TPA: multiheme c-type cytochrome [Terracidiphilus sp.]|nr:multiheme c-type cytochrome [Terracidiphilus sp.]
MAGPACPSAIAQHAAPAVTCATCHLGVVNAYAHAPMRNAMLAMGADPALDAHPNLSIELNGHTYTVLTKDGKSTYTVSDGTSSLTVPIRWILGQHSQTWVLEKDGRLYESLVSYFARDQRLAATPGDEKIVPSTLTEAMGRELPIWEARNCLTCHATGFNPEEKLTSQKLTPGLNCERCHEGAAQHMADAQLSIFTSLPKSLKKMDAGETATFCGQCHRTWDKVVREGWKGPNNVRFTPYRLQNSKCFIAGDRRISCLACHDPHQQINHVVAFYDAKCLACHSPAAASHSASAPAMSSSASAPALSPSASAPALSPSASAPALPPFASVPHFKSCPVAREKCITCHMPKVELAGGHAVFTDHQIRIVQPGEPYPN